MKRVLVVLLVLVAVVLLTELIGTAIATPGVLGPGALVWRIAILLAAIAGAVMIGKSQS